MNCILESIEFESQDFQLKKKIMYNVIMSFDDENTYFLMWNICTHIHIYLLNNTQKE